MNQDTLKSVFEAFDTKNVLVIGDVMVDSYIWGDVERISPEAPVPILSCKKQEDRLGGAANVVLNLKALGATPYTCAVVGNDATGEIFRQRMQVNQLDEDGLFVVESRPTTRKTRMIGGMQQLLRVDEEQETLLPTSIETAFIEHVVNFIASHKIDAIVFEDYDKGVISPKLIQAVVNLASSKDIPTLVDPKKRNFLDYRGVTLFKPNFKELKEGLNLDINKNDFEAIQKASSKLVEQWEQKMVLVTMSELGVFISNGSEYDVIPAEIRDISDVSGAGDTVISIASLCLASGIERQLIAQIANLGGGLVCEKIGVVPIHKPTLLKESLKLVANQ